MPDTKITALAAITTVAPSNDLFPIVDVSDNSMAASGTTKNITVNQLLGAGGIAALSSATITGDLTVDTNTLKVDSANNRVGIRTASPAEPLTVDNTSGVATGAIRIYATDQSHSRLAIQNINGQAYHLVAGNPGTSNAGFALYDNTAAATRWYVDNTGVQTWSNVGGVAGTAMTLNSTGLGVGTSPSYKLDVSSSSNIVGRLSSSSVFNTGFNITNTTGATWSLYSFGSNDATLQNSFGIYHQSGTSFLQITQAGNVGIGVTPSAWSGISAKVLEFGNSGSNNSLWGNGTNDLHLVSNAYFNGANWIYNRTAAVTRYNQLNGSHAWYTAPSGTAGTAITFTQAMTLDASGNLLVGTTAAAGSASNSTKTVGGIFSSVNGTSASTASGSAVTLFASQSEATYMVSAYVLGTGAPATYNAVAIVKTNAGVATLTTISSATNLTISMSGLNVQATQTSGVSQVITYNVIRIS